MAPPSACPQGSAPIAWIMPRDLPTSCMWATSTSGRCQGIALSSRRLVASRIQASATRKACRKPSSPSPMVKRLRCRGRDVLNGVPPAAPPPKACCTPTLFLRGGFGGRPRRLPRRRDGGAFQFFFHCIHAPYIDGGSVSGLVAPEVHDRLRIGQFDAGSVKALL